MSEEEAIGWEKAIAEGAVLGRMDALPKDYATNPNVINDLEEAYNTAQSNADAAAGIADSLISKEDFLK
jgi:hypothetical protein